MSKALIKKHSYRDSNFEIKVNLNFKIEKCLGGKREHLITVYTTDDTPTYNTNHLAESRNLEEIISLMINDAEKWVDKQFDKGKTPEEILLFNLGFDKEL